MSYVVLARKYRPQVFSDVVGQEHITQILQNAIEQNRVAHAFLFCGPRGVGKTTCARIMARMLNEHVEKETGGALFEGFESNADFDVIEIDGASNRGIDEIRALRESVKFAPIGGRYKIYIVDEVHMLTTEAFNALLKTLEEPPAHVKFIFATTESHKVPATIISRCQRFDFKRISVKVITENLTQICKKESFNIDDDAIFAIAKASNGGMRDALSTLDQLSALTSSGINAEAVCSMLGMVETQILFDMGDAIASSDAVLALKTFHQIEDHGKDSKQLLKDLIEHFRHLMIIKVGGKSLGKLVEYPVNVKEMLLQQSSQFELVQLLTILDELIKVQETAKIMESYKIPMEIALTKLTVGLENMTSSSIKSPKISNLTKSSSSVVARQVSGVEPTGNKQSTLTKNVRVQKKQINSESCSLDNIYQQWDAMTHAVSQKAMSLATFLQEGSPISFTNNVIEIIFSEENQFSKDCLEHGDSIKVIEGIFSDILQEDVNIKFSIGKKEDARSEEVGRSTSVDDTLSIFGGEVVNQWHDENEGK